MRHARNVISGFFLIAFGGLGIYCSARGFLAARALHGRPDIDDHVRNWSTAAAACIVAAGVVSVLARRRQRSRVQSQASAEPAPSPWWKSPVAITLFAAVAILLGVMITMIFARGSRAASPPTINERLTVPSTVNVPADKGP